MKIIKVKNYKEMSERASELVIKDVKRKPNIVLGLATGKTPLKSYKLLVKAYKNKKIDFSKVKTFNLDEYYPISKKNKKSFYYYMHKNLFDKVNIKKQNINLLNGSAKNCKKECKNYEKKLNKSKIDIQILGVGQNGHIAFNEPGSEKNSKTRLVELTHIRGKALTMGVSTILKSKKIILLASGKKKAEAIRRLVKGKEDENWPVSYLKKHKNLTVILDEKAGSRL